jgi:hypothetical protein
MSARHRLSKLDRLDAAITEMAAESRVTRLGCPRGLDVDRVGNAHARRLLIEAAWHHRRPYYWPGCQLRRRQDRATSAARRRGTRGCPRRSGARRRRARPSRRSSARGAARPGRRPPGPGDPPPCAGLTLYAVLRELQTLLAIWTGACRTCQRPHLDSTQQSTTSGSDGAVRCLGLAISPDAPREVARWSGVDRQLAHHVGVSRRLC